MANVTRVKRVDIKKLVPYEHNAKVHSEDQIKKLSESIKQFGFISPVLIDEDLNIIAGHGRVKAAVEAGLLEVPCVTVEGLTEAERRAYILADNRLSEFGKWDMEMVHFELGSLESLDLNFDIGSLNFPELPEDDPTSYYGDERERTNKAYNLDKVYSTELTDDFWQMPVIYNQDYVPERLVGFNYAKTYADKHVGIHFFIDDYQFERVWNYPDKYLDMLMAYDCILSPDFSLYSDMPMAMKIWNVYRSRQIGAYYQSCGVRVIPTISWAEPETYTFCFAGVPEGSVVAVSTVGVKKSPESIEVYKAKDGNYETFYFSQNGVLFRYDAPSASR